MRISAGRNIVSQVLPIAVSNVKIVQQPSTAIVDIVLELVDGSGMQLRMHVLTAEKLAHELGHLGNSLVPRDGVDAIKQASRLGTD